MSFRNKNLMNNQKSNVNEILLENNYKKIKKRILKNELTKEEVVEIKTRDLELYKLIINEFPKFKVLTKEEELLSKINK